MVDVSEVYRLAVQLSDGIGEISLRVALANTPEDAKLIASDLRDAAKEADQLAALLEAPLP